MLIQFSVQNYRSFREEQTLSLVAGKDGAHPDSLINCGGKFRLSKVASIYGANASGKSNLVKAMQAMERFVWISATRMNLGDSIEFVSPFRLDTSTVQEPSRFEITLLIEGDIFVYGFSATRKEVHDEWLFVQPQGRRESKWLERSRDKASGSTSWAFRGPLKKDAGLLKEKTRDNGLVLSRAAELNIEAVKPLYLWFRETFWVLDLSFPPIHLGQSTARGISEDKEFQNSAIRFIREADLGINGLTVREEEAMTRIPDDAPKELREFLVTLQKLAGDEKLTRFSVTTEHSLNDGETPISFSLEEDESNGTQRFFALAGPILSALSDGDLLVVDEIDCSMHPLLTRKVVELFQSPEGNTKGAQLVFATHDSSLMDPTLLRRDQIWLTEKQANGATELFSLYDFGADSRPRKGTAFEKNYLAGRYGAVPNFGPFFEDF
jgi:AAA15 family ATPase/GTPase